MLWPNTAHGKWVIGSKAKGCTVYQFCMPGHPCPAHKKLSQR